MDVAKQLAEAIRAVAVDCYCSYQGCGNPDALCQRHKHEESKRLVREALAAYDKSLEE